MNNILNRATGRALSESGWVGWCGGTLYINPGNLSDADLDAALSAKANENHSSVAVVKNTPTHHALRGCMFIPQGYKNTPDGPALKFFDIEGDALC